MKMYKFGVLFLICALLFTTTYAQTDSIAEANPIPAAKEPARENLLMLLSGEWVSRAIYTATKLGVADMLQEGSKSVDELATATQTHADSLYRLMRLLASFGVFDEVYPRVFANTESSLLLAKGHPNSLNALATWYGEDVHVCWDELLSAVNTGQTAFQLTFKQPVFNYLKDNPSRATIFHDAMQEKSNAVIQSALTAYDFSQLQSVVDVGGGYGHFIQAIVTRHPHVKGTVFDLPEVIDILKLRVEDLPENFHLSSGDFFVKVPSGADAYIMKSILHDWDDAQCEKILKNCYQAMAPNSRLLIVEAVLLPKDKSPYASCMDLLMLAIAGGKERSLSSFQQMLERTGFAMDNVYQTATEFSIIEARKK